MILAKMRYDHRTAACRLLYFKYRRTERLCTAVLFLEYGGKTVKRMIPFLMALLLLAGCGAQSEESTYRQVNAEEAAAMMV